MKHQTISFIKSALRIAGYGIVLIFPFTSVDMWLGVWMAGWLALIGSEVVGILEEIGHE